VLCRDKNRNAQVTTFHKKGVDVLVPNFLKKLFRMSEGVNWEELYWDLVGEIALQKAEKARKKRAREEENDFTNKIAPKTKALPNIMTMATPEERDRMIKKMQKLRSENAGAAKWSGWSKGKKGFRVPALMEATARTAEEQAQGLRKQKGKARESKKQPGKMTKPEKAVTSFTVTHLVLLEHGEYPTEEKNCCSHLCHKRDCIIYGHFVWSSNDDNIRREKLCRKKMECVCGLNPRCDFTLHTEQERKCEK